MKSLFMETVPAIVPTVPIGVSDSANIKVCYCVVCWYLANFLGGFEC